MADHIRVLTKILTEIWETTGGSLTPAVAVSPGKPQHSVTGRYQKGTNPTRILLEIQ